MKTVKVYDPAMCCSTGVCGPSVPPSLARFAADIAWVKAQGVTVSRFNLAQEPQEFLAHPVVAEGLQAEGSLPIVLVGEDVLTRGSYPDRRALALALGLEAPAERKSLNVLNG